MNNDQVKGDVKQVKGYLKGTTGKAFGNKSLRDQGKIEPATSNGQKLNGDGKNEKGLVE